METVRSLNHSSRPEKKKKITYWSKIPIVIGKAKQCRQETK